MTSLIHADELAFFSALAGRGSLSAVARELGLSIAALSMHFHAVYSPHQQTFGAGSHIRRFSVSITGST